MVKQNALATVAYLFGIISGIVIYLVSEPKEKYVRFHAIQSILFNIAAFIIWGLLAIFFFPFHLLGQVSFVVMMGTGMVMGLYALLLFIVWLVLMINAYGGKKFKLPLLGDLAEEWSR